MLPPFVTTLTPDGNTAACLSHPPPTVSPLFPCHLRSHRGVLTCHAVVCGPCTEPLFENITHMPHDICRVHVRLT
jgi:hypothetical protein